MDIPHTCDVTSGAYIFLHKGANFKNMGFSRFLAKNSQIKAVLWTF